MPVGNEIFPNIFIDNIEVFDNKVEFMVFIFDYVSKATWSKNNKIKNNLMLNTSVSGDIEKNIKYDVALFSTDKLSDDNPYYQNSIAYYKKITLKTQNSSILSELSIECSLFIGGTNIEGPSVSELILRGGEPVTNTQAYYRNGTQYYGAVHGHGGNIMEGAVHTDMPHAVLDVVTVQNLKIKDYRTDNYQYSSLQKSISNNNLPIFSDLFVSYDEETMHKGIFFVNILEILRKNTKFGAYFDSVSSVIKNRMLDNIKIKSIIVTRNQVNTNHKKDGIYKSIKKHSFLIGFERGSSLIELRYDENLKNNLRYIYHNYGNDILGVEFIDEDLNDKSFGTYQYSIDITFSDKTVEILRSLTQRMDSLINSTRAYLNKLNSPKYYNYNLKKSKIPFYSSEQNSELYIFLANELAFLKSVIFDLSDTFITEEKIRYYNLLEPKSCTIESVSFYLKEATKIYDQFVLLFGKNVVVGGKYEKPASPISNSYTENTVNIKHIFKQLVKPESSRDHYSFNSEPITTTNFKQVMSRTPLMFGSRNKMKFLKSNEAKKDLKQKMNKKIKASAVSSLSVGRVIMMPKKQKEKFTNITEYLGDDSKFATFETKQKCEVIKPDTEVFDDISLNVITGNDDVLEEVSKLSNKIEVLQGFESATDGSALLKKPIWSDINSQQSPTQGVTIFMKQSPTEGRDSIIDFSFPNEYKLLNNLNSRNTNLAFENSDSDLITVNNVVRNVDLFRTSNGLLNSDNNVPVPSRSIQRQIQRQATSRSQQTTGTTMQQPRSAAPQQTDSSPMPSAPAASSMTTTTGGY